MYIIWRRLWFLRSRLPSSLDPIRKFCFENLYVYWQKPIMLRTKKEGLRLSLVKIIIGFSHFPIITCNSYWFPFSSLIWKLSSLLYIFFPGTMMLIVLLFGLSIYFVLDCSSRFIGITWMCGYLCVISTSIFVWNVCLHVN